ncbi:MAG TPA: PHB depolymerase family esterase [Microvirga sp.]|jgi:phospholipase/carboxylesterase|nr:PHB depolymerase family esterase [Microvirga sp.]
MNLDPSEQTDADAQAGRLLARPGTVEQPAGGAPGRHPLGLGRGRDGVVLVPARADATAPAPMILALHGAGGLATHVIDLFSRPAERRGIIVLAPESRASTWDVIRGGYGPDVAFIERALRQVFGQHAVDPRRVAIAGFSDGASYALSLGLTNGDLFGDILAFSPGFMAPTGQVGEPRIFVSHGIQDDVLPIEACSRRLVSALQRGGYPVEYREFGGGHVAPADIVERALDRFLS